MGAHGLFYFIFHAFIFQKMERQKTTKNIGEIKGKLLAFGGPYSNLQALEKIYQIAEELDIPSSNIICTGDVVGYCGQPEETVQKTIEWGIHVIAGNVEIQLREGQNDCGCDFTSGGRCDTFSRRWYPYAQTNLSEASIEWMNGLPDFIQFKYAGRNAFVVHGSFHGTSEYIFKSIPWEIKKKNFSATNSGLIISGHSGLPFHEIKNGKHWLNPGVIGMPANDGTARVWYMVMDEDLNIRHSSFFYEHEKTAELMIKNNLPPEYALTLKTGLWDNTEILPEVETKLTGKRIVF